jgi:uncharacterized protein (DUF58 family)
MSFDPQVLARLNGLKLRARHIAEGYLVGAHRNPRAGFSTEFAEHREYVPGDDLRYMDWKAFGRTDKFYLKRFEDETNLLCHLAVDCSESLGYRGPATAMSKWEYAQCLATALAWIVLRQQDAVGLIQFDERILRLIEPTNRTAVLDQIVQSLENQRLTPAQRISEGIGDIAKRLQRRGIVIIISDLLDDVEQLHIALRQLRQRRCEVVLFHLLDPAELNLPFEVPTMFRGLEKRGRLRVDPVALRSAYREEVQGFIGQLTACCRELRVSYHSISTDEPFDRVLRRFLLGRSNG